MWATPIRWILGAGLAAAVLGGAIPSRADADPPKPEVIASVNGVELTEKEFHRRCERMVGGVVDTATGWTVLKEWVLQQVVETEAKSRNLLPDSDAVERRVKALRKQYEFQGDDFTLWLASHGRSIETLREEVRHQLIAENVLTDGIVVSDVEVGLYYMNHKAELTTPAQMRVSRITVKDKKVLATVDTALKAGQAFAEVAKKHSADPWGEFGGALPDPVEENPKAQAPLEEDVLKRALSLETGKFYGPIKVDDYWVFVKVDKRTPARTPELTDVQELLIANLRVQKAGAERVKIAQARLDQLQREAKIEVFRSEYKPIVALLQQKPK